MNQEVLLLIPAVFAAAMAIYYWFAADLLVDYQRNRYQNFPDWFKPFARIASLGLVERRDASIKLARFASICLMLFSAWFFFGFVYALQHH